MEHKEEILSTRKGYLGSSDANMVANIAKNYVVNPTYNKRLAILLGLEEVQDFSSYSTNLGDKLEDDIFDCLKKSFPNIVSNPRIESELYSRKNFKVMTHIDYMFEDANNVIFIENKATKDNTYVTINKYANQLYWHKMLLIEYCNKVKKTPKLLISHYNTSDYDGEFKPEKLTIVDLTKASLIPFEIEQGLDIIDIYLEKFVYEKAEEIEFDYLPESVQEYTEIIGNKLSEIKQLENDVDNFKAKMLDLMNKNNIKNIKTPYFSITKVEESTQMKFDTTTFKKEHENLYKEFSKPTINKSYILIKTK